MAVLSGATASGKQFCAVNLTTSSQNLYTAPAQSTNVTSPSATAYIKEILICNYSGSSIQVTLSIVGAANLLGSVPINPNDTKVISGLNTMLSAGQTITGLASAGTAIQVIISGVEVQ